VLKNGQTGVCKVRSNENGKLYTHVYNKIAALGIDPIEKKPLYHFYPGKNILSIGEVGCNMHCTFCQNHRISQCLATEFKEFQEITSEEIVNEALKTYHNIGIAYTYNEPFTFYEFLLDTARLTRENGLRNVVVSNGYINPEPLYKLIPLIDAFNIDLKAFSKEFYKKQTKSNIEPVLESLKIIAQSKAHLEITTLIIPGLNDSPKEFEAMVNWISTELGIGVPLHLSRYFPQFELNIQPTPIKKLEILYEIATKYLSYVYLGNVTDDKKSSTYCTVCGNALITRSGYHTSNEGLDAHGNCVNCKTSAGIQI
jgi:pyruvate formate lyase activating enzyme